MENSDTGQELIINSEDSQQPTDAVAGAVEENAEALQSADEVEFELQIDDEGEPAKEPEEKQPDYEMARKAYKEREEKRKKREQEEAERKALNERLAKLEAENQKASLGKPPTLADCDYDEDEYQRKLAEHYQKQYQAQNPANESKQEEPQQEIATEVLIAADKQEQEVRTKYKKYEADKTDLAMKIANDDLNPDLVMGHLQLICHADGTDFAKAVIGLSKVKGGYEGLKDAASKGDVAVARYVRQVAGKVKLAEAKKIDTQPEPEINSSGSIDNSNATVDKLRKQWKDNPTTGNYKLYMQAKAKLKGK